MFAIDTDNVDLVGGRQVADSTTLTNREVMHAPVLTENLTLRVDDIAGRWHSSAAGERGAFDESRVVAIGHEANLLRLALGGVGQSGAGSEGAHLVFAEATDRKSHRAEFCGRHRKQEIALVFVGIDTTAEIPAAVVAPLDARIVAGCDHLGTESAGPLQERRELNVLVALYARIRCFSLEIGIDEIIDHGFVEYTLEVDHVVWNAEVLGDAAGVLDIARTAAAAAPRHGAAGVVEPHGHADDPLTALDEHGCYGCAVHASGEGNDDRWGDGHWLAPAMMVTNHAAGPMSTPPSPPPTRPSQDTARVVATSLDEQGRGVAVFEGVALAVEDLLPGEAATVVIDHRSPHGNKAWAHISARESAPSPNRVPPACRAHGSCGGCGWQHADTRLQLEEKRRLVIDALAGVVGAERIEPTVAAPAATGYRGRGNYVVSLDNGRVRLGAFAPGSHRFVGTVGCAVVDPAIDGLAHALESAIPPELVAAGRTAPGLRFVSMRVGIDGKLLAGLVASSATAAALLSQLADSLMRRSDVAGVIWVQNDLGSDVVLHGAQLVLSGVAKVVEIVAGVRVEVGLGDFTQVNRSQAERLYAGVADLAVVDGNTRAADLYCGVGGFAFAMAARGAAVVGIERNPHAIAAATTAAAATAFADRVRFVSDDAAAVAECGEPLNVVVVDPPRKGLEEAALGALLGLDAARVVYVSCNPRSLARDLVVLIDAGYTVHRVIPWDLMPGTAQVEAVALLARPPKPQAIAAPSG